MEKEMVEQILTSSKDQTLAFDKIAAALAKAQSEIKPATKDATNPAWRSKYATLDSCFSAIREPLSKNGLAIVQRTEIDDTLVVVKTMLIHTSGQFIESTYPVAMIGEKPQIMGSALTYARRYALSSLVGLTSDEDDDANAAQTTMQNTYRKPPAQTHRAATNRQEFRQEFMSGPLERRTGRQFFSFKKAKN